MTQDQRTPLPSGLPKQFLDGRPGFQRLQEFLEIPNTKAVQALLDAVKDAVRVPGKLKGAERRRVALTTFYGNPESRRKLWRQALDPSPPADLPGQPVPSLEFIALQRHDAEFRTREVDDSAVEEALRDLPDLVDSVADAPDWQHPALAAWPALHRDIAEWRDLPEDRREATKLAVFAVATVLDDLRLLQSAAHEVDTLADEFATLLNDSPEDSGPAEDVVPTGDDDPFREWRETCDTIAATARTLGGDPPRPELLDDLSRQVNTLTDLRAPVTEALHRAAPEKLLRRVQAVVVAVAEGADTPIAPWTDHITAQWRAEYPLPADVDVESLRADVERLEADLESAVAEWRAASRRRTEVDERLQEAKRGARQEDDPLKRLDAEDQVAKLEQQLGHAADDLQRAHAHVFQVVAPADQVFDPRRHHRPAEDLTTPEPPAPPEPTPKPTDDDKAETDEAETDEAETDEPDTVGEDQAETDETETIGEAETGEAETIGDDKAETDETETVRDKEAETDEADEDDAEESVPDGHEAPTAPARSDGTPVPPEPPPVERRETSAIAGLWRTLGAGRPGIAYHIARLCGGHDPYATLPPMLADIIAASMLAPHVHSQDSVSVRDIRPILERIDPTALLHNERRESERDALSLLLFSATLRPALFAPTTGAPSLLRAVSLSDGLKPVYDLASRVAEHAVRLLGVRIYASMFPSSQAGTWQQQFDALTGRVRAWHAGADSKRNIYGGATKVWRDLFARDGLLARLMRLISDSDNSRRPDVEAIHRQISDQKTFSQIVQRADRRGPKPNPIVGRALKQIWNDVQPAVDYSREWLRLMDTRPETAGFVSQQVDALRQEVERHAPRAVAALLDLDTASRSTSLAAAIRPARQALDDLLQLFDGDSAITESALAPDIILSRDLLYVIDLKINTGLNTVSTDVVELLDRLQNTDAHANDMRAAFNARLERDDFVGARLALDFIEGEDALDVYTASLSERTENCRRTLRTDLQSAQKRLESAFCRGQLPADDRDRMTAKLTALRQVAEPASHAPPSLHDVEVLTGSSRRLIEVDNAIEAFSQKSFETVRRRLRNVRHDRMDEATKAVVDRTIEQGYVQTAHEQINRLEDGESVDPPPPPEDSFSEFTSTLEAIETARKTTDPQTIVRGARAGERVAAVPFDELAEEDAQSAAGLLDAWYQMARKRSVDKARLRGLLESLGFSVRIVDSQRPGSQATVTTEPIADRAYCPSRQFGSEANGRYRVLLNWDASATDSIFRAIGMESRDPTIVLHFGCLGTRRDEIRKRATREHRLFLVVDETLLLFLAVRATNRLSALFRCTLPYSAAQPYATTSGLVPQELFYGRQRERETIMDQSGACFIYGGRQLGKTALLRQVEKDFGGNDRVAKWIDLKVNEIDRAPDLWRVIQHALREFRVVRRGHEIDPESPKQVESLLDQIREWLDSRGTRRLLLLLDEADHFLSLDEESDFLESSRLKGLMDRTDRRFKVVFAGLHNVLRTVQQANHPLAHLGVPICVGAMTSNGEWKEAQALVREPLQAVGCRFGRDDLSTRILAHTNYYPSLIQLYGAELTRRLRDSDRVFPYAIDDAAIDDAYGSRELRDAIRERFLLTLQLDPRYEVICYALAHELQEGADLDQGLTHDRILEAAQYWWSDGFQLRDGEFQRLLEELEGLGVLRATEPERRRYTLRNPNILLLLGNRKDFEKALTQQERRLESPYAPASFRARYPQDRQSARRGPLTREQEWKLHGGGVGVICGCPAAGLEDVQEFLSQRIGSDEFSRILPAANAVEFERQLRKLRSVRNSVTVRLVPPTLNWDGSWVRAARHVVEGKAQGKRLWNRVAFIATPAQLWRLLTDAAESDLDGVDWFPLGPCDLTFLQRWLDDTNNTADAGAARELLQISGGWPVELDRFGKKKTGRRWQTRIAELQREAGKNPGRRLRDEFGLANDAEAVLRGLSAADDPFDEDSIELVSAEIGVDPGLVRLRVDWGVRLGLLSPAGDASWRFNPLVKRLLEATPGR